MLELDTSKHDLFLGQKVASSLSYLSLDDCQGFPSREGKEEKTSSGRRNLAGRGAEVQRWGNLELVRVA